MVCKYYKDSSCNALSEEKVSRALLEKLCEDNSENCYRLMLKDAAGEDATYRSLGSRYFDKR